MTGQFFFDEAIELRAEIFRVLQPVCVAPQHLRDSGIDYDIDVRNRYGSARHAELELISRKGNRRCTIAVVVSFEKRGKI